MEFETTGDAMMYTFQCFRHGELLWERKEHNLIVADGLMDCLNQYIGGINYQAFFQWA